MTDTFTLLNGQLRLERTTSNPSADGLWLAASVTPSPHARVLDAMCGSGIVGLALLTHEPTLMVTGVDINPACTSQATRNAALNNFQTNYTTLISNLTSCHLPPATFNLICMNPPYHATARGHHTPNPTKTQAHTLPPNALTNWLNALHPLLAPHGTLALILHTACEAELLAFAQTHCYATTLIPLQTSPTRPPKRFITHLTQALKHTLTRHPAVTPHSF